MQNIPEIKGTIEDLNNIYNDYLNLAKKYLKAGNRNVFSVDLLALAAVNRSLSNIKGFIVMVAQDNYFLVNSIVRLQLDTLLRLFAIKLVDEPHGLARKILEGEEIRKIKDKSGNQMTDKYLCEEFVKYENEPWVKTVYKHGSGFIHLSRTHISGIFDDIHANSNANLSFTLGGHGGNAALLSFKIESAHCMRHITIILYRYIHELVKMKESNGDLEKLK